ncbi:hypothetical protein P3509_22800, partial [Vibrio parahaemolyticus]|nr:hypothetical protein [Vibrio parahaemolyticus]
QRIPPKLNHCAVNTKADSNQNCQALRIPLKCFVSCQTQGLGLEFITALPTLALRMLENQIRRSFKAFVAETTWNTQRCRKRTDNTKKTFWRNNATKLTFNK